MAIYVVHIEAPAISETVTTSADSAEEALNRAVASALARQATAATVRVEEMPQTPSAG